MRNTSLKLSVFLVSIIVFCTFPALSQTNTTVIGMNDPAVDIPSVQNAVNNYSVVTLVGTFDFGPDGTVSFDSSINSDVTLQGPAIIIGGGYYTSQGDGRGPLYARDLFNKPPLNLTIRDIYLKPANLVGINVEFLTTDGNNITIENCTVEWPDDTRSIGNVYGIAASAINGTVKINNNTLIGPMGIALITFRNCAYPYTPYPQADHPGSLEIKGNTVNLEGHSFSSSGTCLYNFFSGCPVEISGNTFNMGDFFRSSGSLSTTRGFWIFTRDFDFIEGFYDDPENQRNAAFVDPSVINPMVIKDNIFSLTNGSIVMWLGDSGNAATNIAVVNNTVIGYSMGGIWKYPWGGYCTFVNNDFSGLTTTDEQILISGTGNIVLNNTFGPVLDYGAVALFSNQFHPIAGHWKRTPALAVDNLINNNDYTNTGIPGLDQGRGCIQIGFSWGTPAFEIHDNTIFESGNFPRGTGGAKNHVFIEEYTNEFQLDPVPDPPYVQLVYNNRVVGLPANKLFKPAGIGRGIKAAFIELERIKAEAELEELCGVKRNR